MYALLRIFKNKSLLILLVLYFWYSFFTFSSNLCSCNIHHEEACDSNLYRLDDHGRVSISTFVLLPALGDIYDSPPVGRKDDNILHLRSQVVAAGAPSSLSED